MTFEEYPKFLPDKGVIVHSAEQEKAVKAGKAIVKETKSAEGVDKEVVGVKPKGKKSKARKIAVNPRKK